MVFKKVLKYELLNILRNRWIFIYVLFLFALSMTLIHLAGDYAKACVSLANIVVVFVPLVAGLFTTVYWYYADRFTELLLTQPLSRSDVFFARLISICTSLGLSFVIGINLAFLVHGTFNLGLVLLDLSGVFLTIIFVVLGALVGVSVPDRMKGVGLA